MPQHTLTHRPRLATHLPVTMKTDGQLPHGPIGRVLELQRLVGNQASAALVQRCGGQVHAGCNCAADKVARLVAQRDGNDDDNQKPPPVVGQDRAVDPNDKGAGITGTWDSSGPNKSPRITGAYADPPFNAHGDPFKYDGNDSKTPGNSQGPTGMDAMCGPGKHWAQNGNSGGCVGPTAPATQVDDGTTVPQAPVPQPVVTWGTPEMYQQQQQQAPDSNNQPGDYPTPTPDDDKQTA